MNNSIREISTRSVTNVIPSTKLLKKALTTNRKLNVYHGIDPTATKIHVGHAVALRKLQSFVDMGHNVTFLIGDFTALIGDTSDKDTERPVLTYNQIQENLKTYKEQASKLVDFSKVKVVLNSTWLKKLTFEDVVKLCQNFSVGDFTSRTLIRKRLEEGKHVGLHETLYPVMQGYDSWHLDTDIQIGGADQTFNMQAGRSLQKILRNKESFVLVTGYLEGTDGRKMSKSWGNAIWITDSPNEMFGKVMSLKDELIPSYLIHATSLSVDEVDILVKDSKKNPLAVKTKLAHTIVRELHGSVDADVAKKHFEETFQNQNPDYDKMVDYFETLLEIVSNQVKSNSEAKRILSSGGVKVNEIAVKDPKKKIVGGDKIKIGKKIFVTVKQ